MPIYSITQPEVELNGEVLKWNAVFHPMTFEAQRMDALVDMVFNPGLGQIGTYVKVQGSYHLDLSVGDTFEYFDPNGNVYEYEVASISGQNIVTTTTGATGVTYGGYCLFPTIRKNYHVVVEIFYAESSVQWVSLGTMRVVPDINGLIKIRPNRWLQPLATLQNDFNYDEINKAMQNEGGRFSINVQEIYDGSVGAVALLVGNYYWSNSAKQIGEVYGTNMADYTPTVDSVRDKAKFLSVFDKPTYFVGYPFSLNFLYSDNLGNLQITREEERFDVNGASVDTQSDNLAMSERFHNNRLMIDGNYASNIKELDVWLQAGAANTEGTIYEPGIYDDPVFEPWDDDPNQPVIQPVKDIKRKLN